MGGNIQTNYELNINMIGESLYFLYIYLTRNVYTTTISTNKKEKNSIFVILIHLLKSK